MSSRSGVAVVASARTLADRARVALERRGIRVAGVRWPTSPSTSLGDVVDMAGRRDDVSAVLLYVTEVDDPPRLAAVCRVVAPHLPVVLIAVRPPVADPFFRPWAASIGALELDSLSRAVDAMAVLAGLDPPSDFRCVVVGPDAAGVAATASRCREAGLEVSEKLDVRVGGTLSDLSHDLVVAVIPSGSALEDLRADRDAHPDLPMIALADGPDTWRDELRQALPESRTAVLSADVDLEVGLRLLTRWGSVRDESQLPQERSRDPQRLRRAVRALRAPDALAFAPTIQADLIGALGLPVARSRTAAYLEDTVVHAAELGYPLRVAVLHEGIRWPNFPKWQVVTRSDELLDAAELLLHSSQRELGCRTQLVVAECVAESREASVMVARQREYGLVARLRVGADEAHFVPPVSAARVAMALGRRGRPTPLVEGLTHAVNSSLAAARSMSGLAGLHLGLDIASNGFVCRQVGVLFEESG